MEATHLGAWMAGRRVKDVDDALKMLSSSPTFRDKGWLSSAMKVKEKYPQKKYHSLAIPTWLYGHEPSTPFATHIAKFFENSIREDSILTYAFGGIVYTHLWLRIPDDLYGKAVLDKTNASLSASGRACCKGQIQESDNGPYRQHQRSRGQADRVPADLFKVAYFICSARTFSRS